MTIKILSFGFKNGAPIGTTKIIDLRDLRNPHKLQDLRDLTGIDREVQDYVKADPKFAAKMTEAFATLKDGDTIAFGCFGGRHRSVAAAEILCADLNEACRDVSVTHRELQVTHT